MKLTQKLALATTAIVLVVLAIHTMASADRERALFTDNAERDGRRMGHAVHAALQASPDADPSSFVARIDELDPDMRFRWLARERFDELHADVVGRLRRGDEDVTFVSRASGSDDLRVLVPFSEGARAVGAIEVTRSLAERDAYVRASVTYAALTALAILLLGGLVTVLTGQWMVGRPVRALIDKARRIAAGDLDQPLHIAGRDELGQLGHEINVMSDKIREYRQRVKSETNLRIATLEQLRHAERLTTVGRLAAGVAHEVGTPLNVISARAKLITQSQDRADSTRNATIIGEQSARITGIVRQLLDFARRGTPERTPTSPSELVTQTASVLESLAAKRRVELDVRAHSSVPNVLADPTQLGQVLTNLMVNAIDASDDGGVVRVELETKPAAGPDEGAQADVCVVIAVSDDGCGIAPDALSHVFEPFYTTKDVGSGTGLGLSVSHGIVREHGGWIEVDSVEGEGSRFRVFLPVEDVS